MRRFHLPPLLFWTLLCALFFAPLLAGAARLPDGDFSGQFHAFALFQAREMAAGRLPLWSPGSYGGFPFAADTQAAVFYPPRWLAILLTLPWGFSYYALQLEGIAHVWLAGVFTYLLAYAITRERLAGLLAAVAFGLGGYLTAYPLLQLAILETIAWLPLVLLLLRQGVQRRRALPWLLAAGVVLGLGALAGHPQSFLHVGYTAAAYYLFLAWRARWRWPWLVGLGVLTGAVAAGTAAVAWLPAVGYLAQTTRSDVTYEFVSQGFPLLDYLQLLTPRALSFWAPQYGGMAVVGLTLVAWWSRRPATVDRRPSTVARRRSTVARRRSSGEILFWGITALAAAWVSLGDKGILFELVYHVAPGFAFFRQQERLAGIVSLSLALLAAQGLALWLRLAAAERRRLWRRLAYTLAGGLLLAGVILLMARPIAAANWLQIWLRQWVIAAVVLALLYDRRRTTDDGRRTTDDGRRLIVNSQQSTVNSQQSTVNSQRSAVNGQPSPVARRLMVLVLFLALDLYVSIGGAMNWQRESPAVFWPRPAWLDQLGADGPARLDSRDLFHVNLGEVYGLEDVRGLSPLKPQVVERFEQLPRPRRWQLLNVTHVLAESAIEPGLAEVAAVTSSILPGEAVTARLYRFEAAQPRAWMSYQPIVVADDEAAFQTLQDPDFDPAAQVVLHTPVEGVEAVRTPDSIPLVQVSRRAANALVIEVTTTAPGLLVISEWAYPGWRATIDGRPSPLLTADYALQALLLPAGRHTVALRFVPPGLAAGALISGVTLVAAIMLSWRWQPEPGLHSQRQPLPIPQPGPTGRLPVRGWQALASHLQSLVIARWRYLVLLVVFLGFGLRLFNLGAQELRGDEAFSYLFAALPIAEIMPALLEEGDPHSPLHYLLLHGWLKLAGDGEFAMRYLSLIPGVLLLPLVAQLGRLIGGRRLGMLAAFLAAISQSLVWISQDVRNQYTLALFFTGLATLLLTRLTLTSSLLILPSWKRSILWLVYAVTATLAVYSHYYSVFVLLAHGAYLLVVSARRRWLFAWSGSGIVAVLLFLPWLAAIWPHLLAAGQLSDPDTPELARYLTAAGIELAVGSAAVSWWPRWLFLAILVLCLVGLRVLLQERPGWAVLLLCWLAGTALFIFLVRFSRATFNPFYITLAAPAWWLLVAAGITALWRQRQRWLSLMAIAGLAGIVAVAITTLSNYYFDPDYSRSLGYRSMAAHIAARVQPGDVFLAHFPDPALVYYLRDLSLPYEMQPAVYRATAAETERALTGLVANYDRLWFVPAPGSAWDPDNVVPRWLESHTLPEQTAHYHKLTVTAYRSLQAANQVITPLAATLDDSIRLRGVFVTVNGVPADLNQPVAVQPGSAVNVVLIWEALGRIAGHYTVFVHLLDENGVLVTQHDGVPVAGTRPTFTWTAGEGLIDVHPLTIPAGAAFSHGRLVAGMYHAETVERLLFDGGADAVPLADIRLADPER